MRLTVRSTDILDPMFAEAARAFTPKPRHASEATLERDETFGGGLVRLRRLVEPDGRFRPVDGYRSADGMLSIVRELGESYEAFERRVVEQASFRALHDGVPVALFPFAVD